MAARKSDTIEYTVRHDGVNYQMALIATGCWYVMQDDGRGGGSVLCMVYEQDGKYHSEHKDADGPTFVGIDPVGAAKLYLDYRKNR